MTVTVKVEGFKEVEASFTNIKKATARAIVRRTLIKAGEPIQQKAIDVAPDDPATTTNDLKSNIFVGTKLNKTQTRDLRGTSKSHVEVHVGVSSKAPQGVFQEFGTVEHSAQPFMRPAWDAKKDEALKIIRSQIWIEIEASAKRAAKRLARLSK